MRLTWVSGYSVTRRDWLWRHHAFGSRDYELRLPGFLDLNLTANYTYNDRLGWMVDLRQHGQCQIRRLGVDSRARVSDAPSQAFITPSDELSTIL